MLTQPREFGRCLKQQNVVHTTLYHTGRYLLWQLTQRLPVSVLYHTFGLYNRFHPRQSDTNPLNLVWISSSVIE